jgi:hypothetical protein
LFVLHVVSELPAGRSWADPRERETFADLVIDTIMAHAPNFKASVIARQVLSPLDLETPFEFIGGDIFMSNSASISAIRLGRCLVTRTTGCSRGTISVWVGSASGRRCRRFARV